MGKFAILLCAASTAFATLVFVLPSTINAAPPARAATAQVPGVVDLFRAEKANAPRQALPAQF